MIVNRVFPDELEGGYFGAWRAHQRERLAEVSDGFAPVPVLSARYFEEEVVGARMLDRLAGELFDEPGGGPDPADVLHTQLARELESANGTATLRIPVPFGERGDVSLRQAGAELIVAVGHRKRTIILPAGLARLRPTARLEDGSLEVGFEEGSDGRARSPAAVP